MVSSSLPSLNSQTLASSIEERFSEELIIALIGPVGSGVSTAAEYIRSILTNDSGYQVSPTIKPSDIIRAESQRVGISNLPMAPLDKKITEHQTAGNKLRDKFGGNYLAEKAIEKIYAFRQASGGLSQNLTLLPGRRAYIIDSLKNPEELALLRKIYGESLCVFGVFAPDQVRSVRLRDLGVPESSIKQIMDRDKAEIPSFGQKTRKMFVAADFFVCNDRKPEELRQTLVRFFELIFNTRIHTPTRAESAMYEASSAAANSACMSRQVGAAIVSLSGELISVGWNDVPRFGGGLYNEDDQYFVDSSKKGFVDRDNRCFKWGGCVCHNDVKRGRIIDKIATRIMQSEFIAPGTKYEEVRAALLGTEIDSLTEYSRAIHAEMEAILSVAREGRHSLAGATLYASTYPCHNCARHIVAAGISEVVYIEPYDKSLAIELHYDAVTEVQGDASRVVFRQFDGVAPRNYLRLFRPATERKLSGRVILRPQRAAVPVFQIAMDSPTDFEAKVIADLTNKELNA